MLKAWVFGVVILFVANGIWSISLQNRIFSETLLLLLWFSPIIAAFVSASIAPRKKVLLGASMAIPATIMGSLLNFVYQLLGNAVDFPGLRGGLILVSIMILWNVIFSTVGGIAGYFLTTRQ